MSSPIADTLRDLCAALNGIGQGWYLFGAQAALLRGSRRLTSDIDVTLLPGEVPSHAVVTRLAAVGFTLRVDDVDDFVARTRVIPVVHDVSGMPVDVVLGGPGLEELFLSSSETVSLAGVEIPVPTADHLVVMKLLAGRPRDLEDATAIARAGPVDLVGVAGLARA